MLSTQELKDYIYEKSKAIRDVASSEDIELQVRFCMGKADSFEGTYAFTLGDSYHYLFTEKGEVKFDRVSIDLNEVTYWILETEIFTLAMKYATSNRLEGKDFRRQLFAKEIELHSILGEYHKNKKRIQIEEVLKENPYVDKA